VDLTEKEIKRLGQFKARVPNATENDWVFPDPKHPGRPMTEQNALRRGLKKAAKKLGLHLTWHELRHWAGTMLHCEGVILKPSSFDSAMPMHAQPPIGTFTSAGKRDKRLHRWLRSCWTAGTTPQPFHLELLA